MMAVFRRVLILIIMAGWAGVGGGTASVVFGQNGTASAVSTVTDSAERPLPDIPTLMRAVEANERLTETVEKDYLYRSVQTEQEIDGHGGVKKTETKEYDVFWVNGVQVQKLMKKDGKELSAAEQKKESDRIDKEIAKAKERREKADQKGKETDSHGHDEVTVARLLELGSFTNARRMQLNGRDTIAVDFTGDPKAKTRNKLEGVIRNLEGTAWVDEQDKVLVKVQGEFFNTFRIGGGVLADIQKGTSFGMEQRKVNGEVWLPVLAEGQGSARMLLFFNFRGKVREENSDYRKFKATSTILPGMSTVEPSAEPK